MAPTTSPVRGLRLRFSTLWGRGGPGGSRWRIHAPPGVHGVRRPDSKLEAMNLPMLGATDAPLMLENIPALQDEVRSLARERNAVILAHNYQLPEIQQVADVKAETDYCCTSANAVKVVEHILGEHGEGAEILFGPDMFLGAYVEKTLGRAMHVWDGECHVHAGIRPDDIGAVRAAHPGADFLIHPECGCSTSVMEYVAAGDVDAEGVHMLSTGGMLRYAEQARPGDTAIVATETGMLHPLREAAPDTEFIAANEAAVCRYMKMITLPKLRDSLLHGQFEVNVPEDVAAAARVPIERMVAIS